MNSRMHYHSNIYSRLIFGFLTMSVLFVSCDKETPIGLESGIEPGNYLFIEIERTINGEPIGDSRTVHSYGHGTYDYNKTEQTVTINRMWRGDSAFVGSILFGYNIYNQGKMAGGEASYITFLTGMPVTFQCTVIPHSFWPEFSILEIYRNGDMKFNFDNKVYYLHSGEEIMIKFSDFNSSSEYGSYHINFDQFIIKNNSIISAKNITVIS